MVEAAVQKKSEDEQTAGPQVQQSAKDDAQESVTEAQAAAESSKVQEELAEKPEEKKMPDPVPTLYVRKLNDKIKVEGRSFLKRSV